MGDGGEIERADGLEGPERPERRELLRRAGAVAGAASMAWIAPSILSVDAASAATAAPCLPTLTGAVVGGPCGARTVTVTVTAPACTFSYELWITFPGNAAPSVQVTGCVGPVPGFVQVVPLTLATQVLNCQVEVRVFDACGPGATLVTTLTTALILACN